MRSLVLLASEERFAVAGGAIDADTSGVLTFATSPSQEVAAVLGAMVGTSPGVRGESSYGAGVFGVSKPSRSVAPGGGSRITNPYDVIPPPYHVESVSLLTR